MPSTDKKIPVTSLTEAQRKVVEALMGSKVEGETLVLRVTKSKSVPRPCACLCGQTTKGGLWMPGHDAKLLSLALDGDEAAQAIIDEHETLRVKVTEYAAGRAARREERRASLRGGTSKVAEPDAIVLNDSAEQTPAERRQKARATS